MSDHAHHHHHHPQDHEASGGDPGRRLGWALGLTLGFMVVEVVGGVASGSLALLADAGHMLADVGALGLALAATRLSALPSDSRRSYGYGRAQVLAAFANGVALAVAAAWISLEAAERLARPRTVDGTILALVAAVGLAVNILVFAILHGGDRANLNLRAALMHVGADILGSLAALAAGVVILGFGWTRIDSLLSLAVAALMLWGAVDLMRRSGHILLEGAPDHAAADLLRQRLLAALPELADVHHIHVWSLTEKHPLVTLHAVARDDVDGDGLLRRIKAVLAADFGITHATVQLERGPCPDGLVAMGKSD